MEALYRLAIVMALLTPVGLFAGAPAGAATGVVCKSETGVATLAPGLTPTNKAQTITATVPIAGCSGSTVTSAALKLTLKEKATNCKALTKTGVKLTLAAAITWNTTQTSTVTGTATTGPKVGQVTLAGTVTAGLFQGAHLTNTIMFAQVSGGGGCTAKSPLKKLSINEVKLLMIK